MIFKVINSILTFFYLSAVFVTGNVVIDHRGNSGREKKVGHYFVDGFCADKERVYEFHGCFFHGCQKCNGPDTIHPYRNVSMKSVYDDTLARDEYLRGQGYEVVVKWEHEFRDDIKQDPDLKAFTKTWQAEVIVPINARDAFFGGRTNAAKLHHKCQDGEKIRYLDVTSEYPYVNKYKR